MEYRVTTKNEFDTIEIAQNFESEKFPNMIICLNGELGSGKTIFTKGIAIALGIKDTITSPTFTIIKEYEGELPLYHMDVYRLDGNTDGVGIEEYYDKEGIVIIEWAKMIKDILPSERLEIKFKVVDEDTRDCEKDEETEGVSSNCVNGIFCIASSIRRSFKVF